MKSLLVHIGYHKTGSTWLQRTLFSAQSSWFIPLAPDGDPKYMGRYFIIDEEHFLLSPYDLNQAVLTRILEKTLSDLDPGERVPVISDERLSGNPLCSGFDTRSIADRIKGALPEARILIVIREQKSMIESCYFQYIRAGGVDTIGQFLTRGYADLRRPGFSPHHFQFLTTIRYYCENFSPEQVLVLPYEQLVREPAQFVRNIAQFVSVDIPEDALDYEQVINKRLDDVITPRFPILNFVRKRNSLNAYSPFYIPGSKALISKLNRLIRANPRKYAAKVRQKVDAFAGDRYEAGNRELSRLLGLDLSQYGYHR